MGAGAGSVIIGANDRNTNAGAYVTNHALHVIDVGGGGGGTSDVNIVAVGGNAVTTTVPVTDNAQVTENAVVAADPNLLPIAVERDDVLTALSEADGDWGHLRMDSVGALWVRIKSMVSFLTGGTGNGRPISVSVIATPTVIHTVPAGVTQRIFMDATNSGNSTYQQVVLLFGGTGGSDQLRFDIPPGETRRILNGIPLAAGLIIRAFTTTAANVNIVGYAENL